jgi:hypothetical protein
MANVKVFSINTSIVFTEQGRVVNNVKGRVILLRLKRRIYAKFDKQQLMQ